MTVTVRKLFLYLAVTATAIGCATPDNAEPPAPLSDFEPRAQVVDVWRSQISSQVNIFSFSLIPYVGPDEVFVTDHKGQISAFSKVNGSLQWRKKLALDVSAGVAGDGKNIYVGTLDGDLIALSPEDGSEVWRAKLTTEIIALPGTGEGKIVARSIDGRISLFSAEDGSEIWTYNYSVPPLTIRGNGAAKIVPGGVLVGLGNGKLLALNVENGVPLWEATLSEPAGRSEVERLNDVDAPIYISADSIFSAGFQGQLARISPDRGRILWARELSTISGFTLQDNTLYVSDFDSNVWSLDSDSGEPLWRHNKLRARHLTTPVPVGNYLLVGDFEGYLHWLSRDDGRLVARNQIDASRIINAAVIADDTVYVQTEYGALAALKIVTH